MSLQLVNQQTPSYPLGQPFDDFWTERYFLIAVIKNADRCEYLVYIDGRVTLINEDINTLSIREPASYESSSPRSHIS